MKVTLLYMWCTPQKQGTSDILGKMRFWCHCKGHTFSFDNKIKFILLLFEIWPFVYKTGHCFSGSVILRNWPLNFLILIVLDMTDCRKCGFFVGKLLKNCQKLHGSNRKYIMVHKKEKKSQNWQMSNTYHSYANFNYPYLKMGLWDLFPVLLECIRYIHLHQVMKCNFLSLTNQTE